MFLTGQEEIEAAVVAARQVAKQLEDKHYPRLKVFPLYSALPTHQQLEAFKASPPGMRKLVLSTNVAETSVTIGGKKYFSSGSSRTKIPAIFVELFFPEFSTAEYFIIAQYFRRHSSRDRHWNGQSSDA